MDFVYAYIDNIVVRSRTLEEHKTYLRAMFKRLDKKRVSLAPDKAFVGFLCVRLLGQMVDGVGFTTDAERITALKNIKKPTDAAGLERYLGLTSYLRSKIPYYGTITEPLYAAKVDAQARAPPKGHKRKSYIAS
ncbi:unnamed protein product [Zymoseptoria tritici ST99CH_1E4]|uniref:Reverse transcriptase domain-containing protein n=1 Tax=Zymoseptoria tritici ST99CH_1E4 TaxID=1276532 RepID=A0A2H1G3K6_ZYMTR|nr:unnamed protein product [Zymoseptoria tritici ST99CH_1E4]